MADSPRSRRRLATTEDFERCLREAEELSAQRQHNAECAAAEYLPRVCAKLREGGLNQREIVRFILAKHLGVTQRQVEAADRRLRAVAPEGVGPTRPTSTRPAAARVPAADEPLRPRHAGLLDEGRL